MGSAIINIEEAQKRINEKHGDNIEILEYKNTHSYAKFKCKNGHIWSAIPSSVFKICGCPYCGNRVKYNLEYIKDYFNNNGCEYISGIYENRYSKLEIKFECGHIGYISYSNFKKGRRCAVCCNINRGISKRLPIKDIINALQENNLSFIKFENEYNGTVNSYLIYSCEYGHENNTRVEDFMRRKFCRICNGKLIKHPTGKDNYLWKGGTTPIYIFMRHKIHDWKNKSIKNSDYKCIISKERFNEVHHLQSFNLIVKECMKDLNLELKENVIDYSSEELNLISEHIIELHEKYPLGVCLTTKIHDIFHSIYGNGDNTPDQWYDFENKIKNGEIIIGKEDNL